jgi:hypothetical protein
LDLLLCPTSFTYIAIFFLASSCGDPVIISDIVVCVHQTVFFDVKGHRSAHFKDERLDDRKLAFILSI